LTKTHNSYNIIINLHDENNQSIEATVKVVNGEAATLIGDITSNKEEVLSCPKSYSQRVQLICEPFGYHKTTFDINLTDPITDHTMQNVRTEGDKIVIDLPLLSCQKGDIMVMYNLFFYPNTNIIRQRSNFELQKLLEMLNKNPKLSITIHGHTNGNASGPITKIADNYLNVFNPSETEGINGSSKKLSELRAETIKMYLVNNGIAEDRLSIKGWGGKKMLHHEDSPLSEYNVRVEIEVTGN
jgi:outer membrane protein OmpA-like peptidoglycan-associated protein